MNNDIRQITNFSEVVKKASTTYKTIFVGNRFFKTVQYYVLTLEELTGSSNTPINKLGYICEPRGIDFPIMVTTGNESRMISIGKTGMFEVQPEVFKDINKTDAEEINILPEITGLMIPKGVLGSSPINFKLDYSFIIN